LLGKIIEEKLEKPFLLIFYSQKRKEIGGSLGDFVQCLFTSSGECSFVNFLAGLAGVTPYNPILFWIGIIMLGTGAIIRFSLKKIGYSLIT
jgi:hypothetical protein